MLYINCCLLLRLPLDIGLGFPFGGSGCGGATSRGADAIRDDLRKFSGSTLWDVGSKPVRV